MLEGCIIGVIVLLLCMARMTSQMPDPILAPINNLIWVKRGEGPGNEIEISFLTII